VIGFRFVAEHRADYEVVDLCRVAGVCRSGYYAWRDRPGSARSQADRRLLEQIRTIHTDSLGTYGRPRIWGQLRRQGVGVGQRRVGRLMRQNHLVGVCGRRRRRQGSQGKGTAPGPDLLQRHFGAEGSDQRWVADITEFHCLDGKLYLAGIRDLHDHMLVGWSMGERQTTDLVVGALVMALARRHPEVGVIHHADQGPQFTSLEFTWRLADWGLVGSWGSVGDPADNAAMESFWATTKREIRHIWGPWDQITRSQLRTILFDYIEIFYNRRRHQAALGHRTPTETYHAA